MENLTLYSKLQRKSLLMERRLVWLTRKCDELRIMIAIRKRRKEEMMRRGQEVFEEQQEEVKELAGVE